jgi:hypothetical protein
MGEQHCRMDATSCRESFCSCQCDKCKIAYWSDSADHLRAQLATVTRERDEALHTLVTLSETLNAEGLTHKLATAVSVLEWYARCEADSASRTSQLRSVAVNALAEIRGACTCTPIQRVGLGQKPDTNCPQHGEKGK